MLSANFGESWPSKIGPSVHAFAEFYFTFYMSTVTVGYARHLGSLGIYEGHETALGWGGGTWM